MPMNASCAVSTINLARVLAFFKARDGVTPSLSAVAAASRLATETAKFCSSIVHAWRRRHVRRTARPACRGLPQWDVQHGADAVGHQVAFGKP
jgi:hypothetical protein